MENNMWKEFTIEDFAEIVNHKRIPLSTLERSNRRGNFPYYGASGIIDSVDDYIFEGKHILISEDGENLKSRNTPIAFEADGKFWVNNHAHILKCKKDFYNKILIYYFQNLDLNPYLTGAVQPKLNKASLKSIPIFLPIIEDEQKAIASVLSSLDDKIDLLQQQNQTLEALAETLFRQWFIEEAKEDWEEDAFTLWISETTGGDWGKETVQGEYTKEVYCIRGTDVADLQNGIPTKTPLRFVKEKKFKTIEPKEGDIIIEISGGTENQSTGRAYYINDDIRKLFNRDLVFSNFCRLIRVKDPRYSFFIYLFIKYLYDQDEFFNLENGSSGIKNLDYKAFLFENKYKMPSEEFVLSFDTLVSPYYKKINQNKLQIQTLTKLRDTLLPKLMSGEVRVKL